MLHAFLPRYCSLDVTDSDEIGIDWNVGYIGTFATELVGADESSPNEGIDIVVAVGFIDVGLFEIEGGTFAGVGDPDVIPLSSSFEILGS